MGANPPELINQSFSSVPVPVPVPVYPFSYPFSYFSYDCFPVNWPARFPVNSPAPFPVNSPAPFHVNSPARFPVNSPARFPVNSPARFPVNSPARFPVNSPAPFHVNSPARFPVNSPARFPVNSPARFTVNSPAPFHVNSPPYFPGVQLRGLPWLTTQPEIANFFPGLGIIDTLIDYENEHFIGNAFCVFAYSTEVEMAIGKNGQMMGLNSVGVFKATRDDYYEAIAKIISFYLGKIPTKHTGILRLLGLPNSVDKQEIVDFFKDFVVTEESVYITTDSNWQQNGEAYVEFNNAEASMAAMAKDKMMLRDHYICLFPSWLADFEKTVLRCRRLNDCLVH